MHDINVIMQKKKTSGAKKKSWTELTRPIQLEGALM